MVEMWNVEVLALRLAGGANNDSEYFGFGSVFPHCRALKVKKKKMCMCLSLFVSG